MPKETTRIIASVSEHWLIGSLPLAGGRIQEVLNDANTEFLQLSKVSIYHRAKCQHVVDLNEVTVPKKHIELIVVPSDEHEAPVKRWNNLSDRIVTNAFAIVNDCSMSGELHLPTNPSDARYTLLHQVGDFVALTGASLSLAGPVAKPVRVSLLFANKDYIKCFHVGQASKNTPTESVRRTLAQQRVSHLEEESALDLVESLYDLIDESRVEAEINRGALKAMGETLSSEGRA
jgi:hypothetical protein